MRAQSRLSPGRPGPEPDMASSAPAGSLLPSPNLDPGPSRARSRSQLAQRPYGQPLTWMHPSPCQLPGRLVPAVATAGANARAMNIFLPTCRKILPNFQKSYPVGVQITQTVQFAHFQVQARKRGVLGWGSVWGMSLKNVSYEAFVFPVFSRNREKTKPLTCSSVSSPLPSQEAQNLIASRFNLVAIQLITKTSFT